MSNFLVEFQKGLSGEVPYINTPFNEWNTLIGPIQKKKIHLVGAYLKTGKTSWVDYLYILHPYLIRDELVKKGITLKYRYYSYEIDRITKEVNFICFFLWELYKIRANADYIIGVTDEKPTLDIQDKVKRIYEEHIIPIFGRYDENGTRIEPGIVEMITERKSPTGIFVDWLDYAGKHGEITYADPTKKKILSYIEYDPKLFSIGIYDHVGLIPKEKGYTKKDNLDKFSSYLVFTRNMFKFLHVPVSQFNRGLGRTDRIKFSGEQLAPQIEDFKDTGNLSEDADLVMAMFNPSIYPHIEEYYGYDLSAFQRYFRSVHILANRSRHSGIVFAMFFDYISKKFTKLPSSDSNELNAYIDRIKSIDEIPVL